MKQPCLKIYPLLALLTLFFTQCEEESRVYPDVTILSPKAGSAYGFGDTVIFEFEARPAQKVRYRLSAQDGSFVVSGRLLDQVDQKYTVAFYLDNRYMPSGKYELKAIADYKGESRSAFRGINYNELPLQPKGFVAVGGGKLYKIDSAGNQSVQDIAPDYTWVQALEPANEIFVAGPFTANLQIYSLQNIAPKASLPGPNAPGAPQFYQLLRHNQEVFTLMADGFITSYTGDNLIGVRVELGENELPTQATFLGNQMAVTVRKGQGGNQNELQLFNEEFLGVEQSYFIGNSDYQLTPVGPNQSQIALFKTGANFELETYNLLNQTPTTRLLEPNVELLDCETLPNGDVIYTTENGTYIYNIGLGLNPNKVLTFGVQDIEVNRVTGRVLVLNNGIIQQLASDGSLIYEAAVPGATDFEIFYNK